LVNQFFPGKKVTKHTEIDINRLLEGMEEDIVPHGLEKNILTANSGVKFGNN